MRSSVENSFVIKLREREVEREERKEKKEKKRNRLDKKMKNNYRKAMID